MLEVSLMAKVGTASAMLWAQPGNYGVEVDIGEARAVGVFAVLAAADQVVFVDGGDDVVAVVLPDAVGDFGFDGGAPGFAGPVGVGGGVGGVSGGVEEKGEG